MIQPRLKVISTCLLCTVLLAACDFWPTELRPLADSIEADVSGEVEAWLVGKNIVVINIAHSNLYQRPAEEVESKARQFAMQAAEAVEEPLESVVVMVHENETTEDESKIREFIFITADGELVLTQIPDSEEAQVR